MVVYPQRDILSLNCIDAARRQAASADELRPLSGTIWQVINIVPAPKQAYKSIISNFRPDGIVVTTKTNIDGKVESDSEQYRIVGSTPHHQQAWIC